MASATVVLAAVDDPGLDGAIARLCELSRHGLLKSLLIVRTGPGETLGTTDIPAQHLSFGDLIPTDLFGELAKSQGLSAIHVYGACTAALEPDRQGPFGAMTRQLRDRLVQLAYARTPVHDYRVFFPESEGVAPKGEFFNSIARFNFAVIPEDREYGDAFALPVGDCREERFQWHTAVELASLVGLWTCMDRSPVEELDPAAAGVAGALIRLVRSIVQSSISPHPSIDERFEGGSPLPLPEGSQRTPDPSFTSKAAKFIYENQDFQSPEPERPGDDVSYNQWTVLGKALRRIASDLYHIPRRVKKAFKRELTTTAAEATQLLVGEDSRVRVVPRSDEGADQLPIHKDVEEAIEECEDLDPDLGNLNMDDSWDEIIEQVLGVIDGSKGAEDTRRAAGGVGYVENDKAVLVPEPASDAGAVIEMLSTTEGPEREGLLQFITGRFIDECRRVESRYENFMRQLEGLRSGGGSKRGSRGKAIRWGKALGSLILLFAVTCLTGVGDRFVLGPPFTADFRFQLFVGFTGLIAIPVSLLFLPHDNQSTAPDSGEDSPAPNANAGRSSRRFPRLRPILRWLRPIVRWLRRAVIRIVRLFNIRGDRQAYLFCYLTGILLPTVFLIVFAEKMRVRITDTDVLRWLLALMIACVMVVAVFLGIRRTKRRAAQGGELTQSEQLAYKLTKYAGTAYFILVAIVGINRYRDSAPDALFWDSGRLLVFLLIVGGLMGATSWAAGSVVQIREELAQDEQGARVQYLKKEAQNAKRGKELATVFYVQWLGTATVLARLIWWPYGKPPTTADAGGNDEVLRDQVRKFRNTRLDLTEVGRGAFWEKIRHIVSKPGYLTGLYGRVVTEYARREANDDAAQGHPDQFVPQHDPYPESLEDARQGTARGHRWLFAYQMCQGTLDGSLRESVESDLATALLDTFLEVPDSWVADEGEASEGGGLASVFSRIAPGETINLPTGNLGMAARVNLGGTTMESFIWWPRNVDVPNFGTAVVTLSEPANVRNHVILEAVRVDISGEVMLSTFEPPKAGRHQPSSDDQEIEFEGEDEI